MRRGGDGVAIAHAPVPLAGLLCVALPYARTPTGATRTARLHGGLNLQAEDKTMADADKLTFTLSTGGDVVIKLRSDLAPGHVQRITDLAKEGFYDGVVFHRVIPGFMAQGGDPTGSGMGGSKLPDLKAEFSEASHIRGTCSMARAQNPNSANSQFFICFDDAGFLDNQ
jgi:peptidylprolyl isomerase